MAHIGISVSETGLATAGAGQDVEAELRGKLARTSDDAPIVVFVHGYRFDPALPEADPHLSLFAPEESAEDFRVRSWPRGLGFTSAAPDAGLSIGFGWPAVRPIVSPLLTTRRTGFAHVYDRAAEYGPRLAQLISLVQRLAPGRPVDILAHSLGARVALAALPHLTQAPGRMILLGAAEFEPRAIEFLRAAPGPVQVYNITARANDFYDAAFETLAPRRTGSDRAVGLGLRTPLPNWMDLQIDRDAVTAWINGQGIGLGPSRARFCHWGFYTRDGAFAVYRAILRREAGWDIPSLRAEPALMVQDPRWSRLLSSPRLPRLKPARLPDIGGLLESA